MYIETIKTNQALRLAKRGNAIKLIMDGNTPCALMMRLLPGVSEKDLIGIIREICKLLVRIQLEERFDKSK